MSSADGTSRSLAIILLLALLAGALAGCAQSVDDGTREDGSQAGDTGEDADDTSTEGSEGSTAEDADQDRDRAREQASAVADGLDLDDDGRVGWIRIVLTMGENAPYQLACPDGSCQEGGYGPDTQFRVEGTDAGGEAIDADEILQHASPDATWSHGDAWDVGGPIYVDCGGEGEASVQATVNASETDETLILDASVRCGEAAGGPSDDHEHPEQASATAKGLDGDDNGDVELIRITLTRGENAPYTVHCDADPCTGAFTSDTEVLVSGSDAAGTTLDASSIHEESTLRTAWGDGDGWDVGQALYIDCGGAGTAELSASVGPSSARTTILDTTIRCDE